MVVDTGPGTAAQLRLHGRTLVEHARDALMAVPGVHVLVVGSGVPGGTTLAPDEPWRARVTGTLVLHDPGCPLLPAAAVRECLDRLTAAGPGSAVVGVRPVTDTIKEVREGAVLRTLERTGLWAVQTPQAFRRDALERALDQPVEVLATATDDASLVEALGGTVRVVEAPRENLKITTPVDLRVAELLLAERAG